MSRAKMPVATVVCCIAILAGSSGCAWLRKDRPVSEAGNTAVGVKTAEAVDEPVPDVEAVPAKLSSAQAPARVAEDFYTMHMRMGDAGLPDAASANAYAAFLCPALAAQLETARLAQQAFIAQNPGEKPPFVDGDLFSSLHEGADAVKAGSVSVDGELATVSLALSRGTGSKATRWTDRVLLSLHEDSWCVADIEYQGDWEFANRGRLSDALKANP